MSHDNIVLCKKNELTGKVDQDTALVVSWWIWCGGIRTLINAENVQSLKAVTRTYVSTFH